MAMQFDSPNRPCLFLIRHAQSGNNASPESQRVSDPHITPLGHRQAEAVARFLAAEPIESLICSAFRRALQTAHYIRQSIGTRPEIIIDLHEQGGCFEGWHPENFRGMPGLTAAEILAEFGDVQVPEDYPDVGWWGSKPREDQTASTLRAGRMVRLLQNRLSRCRAGHVVCVTHADFLAKLFLAMFGESIQEHEEFHDLKNVGLTRVTLEESRWQLQELNSVAFLPSHWHSS